ncbi:hypothetical protein M885DRAFT_463954 [Pelagophyceae sp. CCMP2097]|nr:hypothetical protein M885DRAFT_463954 [Pelagophyceae sp. CCMP2097]
MDGSKAASERPSNLRIHAALVFTQIIFGAGSVVGSLGLPAFNPLLFALIREGCAGPILLAISMLTTSARPWHLGPADRKGVGVLGLTIFGNQLFFIVGLKLSNPVAGSIWQPSQPIITAALAIALGWERARARRLAGIAIAFAGCATMVGLSASAVESSSMQNEVIGNACFFINCFATSCYVLRSKPMLRQWPSICITAWAYMCASFYMLAVGFVLNSWPAALKFLCSDCTNGGWHVPPEALPALAYWIIFQSVLAYQLMTWANKFVSASLVSAYSVLQPVTSASLTATILLCNAYRNCADQDDDVRHCLSMPGYADLGSLGVFVGLYFVVTSEAPHDEAVALTAAVNPLLADSEEADA